MNSVSLISEFPPDYAPGRFDSLISDLEGLGLEVHLEHPMERRGGTSPFEVMALITVVFHTTIEKITDELLDSTLAAIRRWWGSRKRNVRRPARTVKLLGPDGELLREVEVSDDTQ
jgi:hypothetical protein